jgi:tetratricopeptide (TPR) repeat protein
MRPAVVLSIAWLCLGCHDLAGMARAHAYTVARNLGGVDSTSLTIPLIAPLDYPSSITNPLALRAMLRRGDFETLDSLLTDMADSAHVDFHDESRLYAAYDAFMSDSSLAGPLDRWVQSDSSSAPALIARASYLIDEGWRARGTAYSRYTPRSAMQRMNDLFARATADLDSAIALTSRTAAAYRLKIQIAKVTSNFEGARQDLIEGLKDIPASYGLRRQYMRNLVPRWGGSYDGMRAFATWSEKKADINPRLRALAGYIPLDSAEMLEITGQRSQAVAVYASALTYGDEEPFHLERGQCLFRMHDYADALRDLDAAVAMAPTDAKAYLWRGMVRESLMRSNPSLSAGALSDFQHAVLLDPSDDLALTSFMLLYTRVH